MQYKHIFKVAWFISIIGMISACQSEIDKCVASNMAAWHVTLEKNQKYNSKAEQHNLQVSSKSAECKKVWDTFEKEMKDFGAVIHFPNDECVLHEKIKIDTRSVQEVEAEYRNYCMSLSRGSR